MRAQYYLTLFSLICWVPAWVVSTPALSVITSHSPCRETSRVFKTKFINLRRMTSILYNLIISPYLS